MVDDMIKKALDNVKHNEESKENEKEELEIKEEVMEEEPVEFCEELD